MDLDHQGRDNGEKKQLVPGVSQRVRPPRNGRPFGEALPGGEEGASGADPKMGAEWIDERRRRAKGEADDPFFPRAAMDHFEKRDDKQPGQADGEAAMQVRPRNDGQNIAPGRDGAALPFPRHPKWQQAKKKL